MSGSVVITLAFPHPMKTLYPRNTQNPIIIEIVLKLLEIESCRFKCFNGFTEKNDSSFSKALNYNIAWAKKPITNCMLDN